MARPSRRSGPIGSWLLASVLVAGACNPVAGTPGASGAIVGGTAAPSSDLVGPLTAGDATQEAISAIEDELYRASMRSAGGEALLGAGLVDAVELVRKEVGAALLLKATSGVPSPVAALGLLAGTPRQVAAGEFSGNLVSLTTFIGRSIETATLTPESDSRTTSWTSDQEIEVQGTRARVATQSSMTLSVTGSTLSGTTTQTITVTRLDPQGRAIDTIVITTNGNVEIAICPAVDGSVDGSYDLEVTTTSASGTSRFSVSGQVKGLVLDDAFVHSFSVDSTGSANSSGPGVASTDRAVSMHVEYALTGAPGDLSQRTTTSEVGTVDRADPAATIEDLRSIAANSLSPGLYIGSVLFDRAQAKWRGGACVRIKSTEPGRDVTPDEQVSLIGKVFHKIDGDELQKPIVATLTGERSISPVDTNVMPPASFTYVAPAQPGKVEIVHLKSTSNRGIGTLDARFRVVKKLVLELRIDSTMRVTKYNGFAAGTDLSVQGEIQLQRDPATGTWSGTGELASLTTSDRSGCNAIEISGFGSYDWVVRDVIASPGLPADQIRIHMDAGPISEQPDSFNLPLCSGGAPLTGTLNTWENLFFLLHRGFYKANGFEVDDLGGGASDTSTWQPGMKLGGISWVGSCEFVEELKALASCDATTDFELVVIEESTPPVP